jgi:hypothetical protein
MDMHHSFPRSAEWHVAHDSEREFVAMARAIRDLAREAGVPPEAAIDRLAERGPHAALALLARKAGTDIAAHPLYPRVSPGAA